MHEQPADLILHNGKIATQDDRRSIVEALAIRDGKFLAVGSDREVMRFRAMQQLNGLADLRKTRLRDFPRLCWFCALALFLFPVTSTVTRSRAVAL
jgi:hypothetical protein